MNFGRILKDLVVSDKPLGKASEEVKLIPLIHRHALKGVDYSKKEALDISLNLLDAVDENNLKLAADIFSKMYALFINARPRAERSFHPSTLKGDCSRFLWYDVVKKEMYSDEAVRSYPPQIQVTFDLGTWFHLYVQGLLQQSGVLIEAEVPVKSSELHISGHGDGIVIMPDKRLLEIKTMNANSFKRAIAGGVFENHKDQVTLYMYILELRKTQFIYFNKDNSEMLEFTYFFEKDRCDRIVGTIRGILLSKEAPPRICSDKRCDRALQCPYHTLCFK